MIKAREAVRRLLLPLLAGCLFGCVPPAIVFLSPQYNPARIRSVTLAGFQDCLNVVGSGKVAAGIFEKYLLLAGYGLVDRVQAQRVLDDQSVALSDSVDLPTLRKIGNQLGVDAVVFGQLSDFTESSDRTVVEDMPLEQSQPIYGQVKTIQHNGDQKVITDTMVVTGYSYSTIDVAVQQTETVLAHVGMSARLVDVQTGELLWSGSASGQGAHLNEALEVASEQIMKSVSAHLKNIPPLLPGNK